MSRKPSPPISYGDEVALPGIAALNPLVGDGAPPMEDIDTASQGRGGRRPILDKSAPTLVYIGETSAPPVRCVARLEDEGPRSNDRSLRGMGRTAWVGRSVASTAFETTTLGSAGGPRSRGVLAAQVPGGRMFLANHAFTRPRDRPSVRRPASAHASRSRRR
jgi:hypothetical protein